MLSALRRHRASLPHMRVQAYASLPRGDSGKPKEASKPVAATHNEQRRKEFELLRALTKHLWPSSTENPKDALQIKSRVVASLTLLLFAKMTNITVPFIFKELIESFSLTFNSSSSSSAVKAAATLADHAAVITAVSPEALLGVPISLVIGYGMARTSTAGFTELRNAIFSKVALSAIRTVATDTFRHLLYLDLSYHLTKNTGEVTRVLDRGSRSINFALSQILFNVFPTALEVSLVSSILAYNFGAHYAAVAVGTIGVYTLFTVRVSDWRTQVGSFLPTLYPALFLLPF